VLPWAERLSPRERERLRSDLALVLGEPEATGEPLDWGEVGEILQEAAEAARWEGVLVEGADAPVTGLFSVDLRPHDAERLAGAPPTVQRAVRVLLNEFLPAHPTAGALLPRGRLKKMKDRDLWQIGLPDGYRLRYLIDADKRVVHIVYVGPHPDGDPRGREEVVRARVHWERRWGL
jgi:hypothetical protein